MCQARTRRPVRKKYVVIRWIGFKDSIRSPVSSPKAYTLSMVHFVTYQEMVNRIEICIGAPLDVFSPLDRLVKAFFGVLREVAFGKLVDDVGHAVDDGGLSDSELVPQGLEPTSVLYMNG